MKFNEISKRLVNTSRDPRAAFTMARDNWPCMAMLLLPYKVVVPRSLGYINRQLSIGNI